ncbi:HtaA domain-containing protein [Conexibacter stalactiti]|uniref:HtaA domain-containing protein n=1 Tax=Conexibacter stalactiti TaxID=1940611 RepID=A0ABU4HXD1_9ACTN|nr:HtaA domain-containing protein [Conexibacter stalactiti]MDW5597987.1 HtaA domain-containing protein [Conexibacter stalactiti]MEC5038629.1 HtaA domain-containing protein [Conexibacter stalactiti]
MTRLRPRSVATVLALTALPAVALPATAGAAASGSTTIELKGAAASALNAQKVRISAQKPARATASRIVLPVSGGTVAAGATLKHGGSVTFRSTVGGRARSARLTAWQTRIGTREVTVSAKLAGKRVTLFALTAPKRDVSLDAANRTATVDGGRARLTAAGAKALRTRLALRRLPAAPLGAVKVAAKLGPGTNRSTGTGNVPRPTNPTTPTTPTTPTPTAPAVCDGYSTGTVPAAAAPLARPTEGASNVASAPMVWYGRDSWMRYISSGLGANDGIQVSEGATLGAREKYPEGTESFPDPTRGPTLVYSATFAFDAANSWYQAAGSDSKGRLAYTGAVRFLWEAHGIDLTFKNPEIELNGASSRLVFTVTGAACSNLPAKRVDLFKLTVPAPTEAAPTFTYAPLAARITNAGATLFSNMYFESNAWGSIRNLVVTTG